jgi:hypothetical protein
MPQVCNFTEKARRKVLGARQGYVLNFSGRSSGMRFF